MARYVLFAFGLLALCVQVSADYWPAGIKGASELETSSTPVAVSAKYDKEHSKYKSGHKHGYKHKPYSSKHDDDDDEKHGSHKHKTHKPSPVPPPGKTKGYYAEPPGAPGPKDEAEWYSGESDRNTPYEHTHEHEADCIGSRHVHVTGPENNLCPPQSDLYEQDVCNVPTFCGANGSPFTDGDQIPGQPPLACSCAPGEFLRGDAGDIKSHFFNQPGPFPMVDVTRHTYSCVDARAEEPILGTAGGDLAEIMAAATAIMNLKGETYNQDIVDDVFDFFADEVATEERPLYFHTDDGSLRLLFPALKGKLVDKKEIPSIFPWEAPEDPADREAWLKLLVEPLYNGCGHIRLMLVDKTKGYYSVQVGSNPLAACGKTVDESKCIAADKVAARIIEKYFRFWWFTPPGSEERRKTAFQVDGILQGSLRGKGVAIIQNKPGDGCPGHAPLVRGSFGGSQVFIFHGSAVLAWRMYVGQEVAGPLLEKYDITADDFISMWTNVANLHLTSTLTYLQPANRVGQFLVDVPVKEVEPEEGNGEYGEDGSPYGKY